MKKRLKFNHATFFFIVGVFGMASATWGAWVAHPVAGLNILGIDLAEYVKFLPSVRNGSIFIIREGFLLPLVTLSAALSATALASGQRVPNWLRVAMPALAIPCALALLPPAWSLNTFSQSEFRAQLIAMSLLLALAFFALFSVMARRPRVGMREQRVIFTALALLTTISWIVPLLQWQRVLPAIETIYNRPLNLGWGGWALLVGGVCLSIAQMQWATRKSVDAH